MYYGVGYEEFIINTAGGQTSRSSSVPDCSCLCRTTENDTREKRTMNHVLVKRERINKSSRREVCGSLSEEHNSHLLNSSGANKTAGP